MMKNHEVVICGAGIAGVSAAYFLAQAGIQDIVLVDERAPLTLTSDRSTECYRNWWPDSKLMALMNRSIDLMEQLAVKSQNSFHMNRRGYLYVTAEADSLPQFTEGSTRISAAGGGPLRIHSHISSNYTYKSQGNTTSQPTGADLLLGADLVRKHFPYLTDSVVAALHVRRAGWLSAQQLGMHLLDEARAQGVQLRSGRIEEVKVSNGQIRSILLNTNEELGCSSFVNAAGPYFKHVAALFGVQLPVVTELHMKAMFKDPQTVVARDAPLLIWNDTQILPWDKEERTLLRSDPESQWLTESLPGGAHTRPEGSGENRTILMLWDYKSRLMDPVIPEPLDPQYPEIVLRGLSTMLPGLRVYFSRASRPIIDGGYYVKTPENRMLVGPTPVRGAYLIGAASGYGIMSACAAGELLAAHVTKRPLPPYADSFSLSRYERPEYQKSLRDLGDSGEL